MNFRREDIERIADTVLRDYLSTLEEYDSPLPLNIEDFARKYLGLRIDYRRLSFDGDTLGMTTMADMTVQLPQGKRLENVFLPEGTILIDSSLNELPRSVTERARYRFTLAHECAHQILFRLETQAMQDAIREQIRGKCVSLRELKSQGDWDEWQANVFAAALLMPEKEVKEQKCRFARQRMLYCFGGRYNQPDALTLTHLCFYFGVSRDAMAYRLHGLGILEYCPAEDYFDPTEVICDEVI